ncbi:MAG: aspartyl-phosphate phosphatase Spo0E family protein [Clostridia bacterium]
MLEEKINKLKEKLNKSIIEEGDYEKTYKISVELDKLIAKYYMENVLTIK